MRFLACLLLPFVVHSADRPNILFILTDDQGYGDVGAHGNPVLKTPHLDRLRSESVRFTDFQVSPTCAPTRSALLTGRHEFKNGITHTILERERLALGAATLAEQLQKAGYRTGIFGKWHLGDEAEYQPNKRGFDEVYIHGAGGIGQSYPGSCGDVPKNSYFGPTLLHNGKFVKTEGYCTDEFFAQATKWIEGEAAAKRPFLAWVATNAPHAPYNARPEDAALYEGKGLGKDTENFFGMLHNIDQNVGKILAKLEALGIAKDTLVVFMNDNGGTAGTKVFNAGMRAQKGSPFMGGIRAISFWRLPGRFQPADVKALAAHIDFAPTILELTGAAASSTMQAQLEGRSLVPLLTAKPGQEVAWPDRTLFTHVGRWNGSDPEVGRYVQTSVRTSRWHLVSAGNGANTGKGKAKAAAKGESAGSAPVRPNWQLFDLGVDYGETTDVAAQHPQVVGELVAKHDAWWKECRPLMVNEGIKGPTENPYKVLYRQQMGK
ncbi:MAG: arylsulfatase [Verrucomicrobiae bacterium]|jgi:arylsulfatase A-like enzyme|nr:arylsulfatase [Verrucomicrobiae bacterium]